ncbi:MAG: phosphocholine cytidylyltransferase family protein [Actinobacteria bacterium]|jgi:choline kinase|nr:phosphocholine cytidylyltransferase family protein [Actinomycetota bacterium]
MTQPQVTILAAGMGTRLGRPFPKPLTPLNDGRTIMQQQLDNISEAFGADTHVQIVVGFKLDLILEAAPEAVFVYNERYDQTNTCKSLMKALRSSAEGPVVWMNGDVVFEPAILKRLQTNIDAGQTAIAVNTAAVSDEEVKYTVDAKGLVKELSKTVVGGLGESVGINVIAAKDKAALIKRLEECDDQDYFERGIELAIEKDGLEVLPIDISDLFAVEVDFEADLERANQRKM